MMVINQSAFTLIELLTTVAIIAILLMIAVPGLSTLVRNQQHAIEVSHLIRALNFARAKAITSRATVSICGGKLQCQDSPRWRTNYLVFIDADRNGRFEQGDSLLSEETIGHGYNWQWANFRRQQHMSFKQNGTTHSLNGSFTLCDESKAVRKVILNTAGRLRVERSSDHGRCLF